MTTVEKLFVQIFERKNWIIDQVKQQTDLYTQHLASKCLIQGITPPYWLWSPNFHSSSSNFKVADMVVEYGNGYQVADMIEHGLQTIVTDLNKEELISELLFPLPRPTVSYFAGHYYLYNNPVVSRDNGELSDGQCMEPCASNRGPDTGEPRNMPVNHNDDIGCALKGVSELGASVTSPEDQTDIRISNIYSAPDQSLARIQRSKSRQKALEIRNSAKATAKSHLSHENTNGVSSSGNALFNDASHQVNHVDEPSCSSENNLVSQAKQRDYQQKYISDSIYCGSITRSRNENRSFQLDGSCNVANRYNSILAQSTDKFVQYNNRVSGLLETGLESCGLREARKGDFQEEKNHNAYSGRTTQSRSLSQQHRDANESSKQVASLFVAKTSAEELAQPICKSLQQLNEGNISLGLVESSDELLNRRKISETTSAKDRMPKPVDQSSSLGYRDNRFRSGVTKGYSLQESPNRMESHTSNNEPARDANPPSDHIHESFNQEINADGMIKTESVSNGPVEPLSVCSRLKMVSAILKRGLTGAVLRPPSDICMSVKPKQLDFDNLEECNANTTLGPSKNNKLNFSSEKVGYTVPAPSSSLSLDEITVKSTSSRLLGQQSPIVPETLTESEKLERHSFGANIMNLDERPMLKSAEDSQKALGNTWESCVLHEANSLSSNVDNSPAAKMHEVQSHLTGECESSLGWQVQEDLNGSERRNNTRASISFMLRQTPVIPSRTEQATEDAKGFLVKDVMSVDPSNIVPDSTRLSFVQNDENLLHFEDNLSNEITDELACAEKTLTEEMFQSGKERIFKCGKTVSPFVIDNPYCIKLMELKVSNLSWPDRRFSTTTVDSWPQSKRRKIEDGSTDCFSASASFLGPSNEQLKGVEGNLDAYLKLFPASLEANVSRTTVKNSPIVEIHQNTTEGTELSQKVQLDKGEAFKERKLSSTFKYEEFGPTFVSNSFEQEAANSRGSLVEEVGIEDQNSITLDLRKTLNKEDFQHLLHNEKKVDLISSDLTCTDSISQASTSHARHKSVRDIIGPDQTMPVLEGFIIDAHLENKQPGAAAAGIDFGRLDLSSNPVERASVMEQICKSASLCTPLSHFSTFKLHRTQDVYKSVPHGLFEHLDLKSTLALDDNVGKQLRASYGCVDEINGAFQEAASSEYLTYSDARYGWNARNVCMSPDGKLWEKNLTQAGSSEKKLSLNPELTCFTIEEDPNIGEHNEYENLLADKTPARVGSLTVNSFARIEPLADITVACSNPPAEILPDRSSLDSLETEISFRGTQNWANQNFRNDRSNKRRWTNEAKENQALSFNTKGIRSSKEVNRVSRPKFSGKSSLRIARDRQSEKKSKPNNIVSDISSFIPLVQKKQAAVVSTGNRNIKVKALKAAEAAKRLAEQRENERRKKKEESKLERARLEQENMRQMELNKKKKEEEQKKRDVDMIARKRQREEEERKEKERKRKRIKETRPQQKEQEGKVHFGKSEKQKQPNTTDDEINERKEFRDQSEKHQKSEQHNVGNIVLEKAESQLSRTSDSTSSGSAANIALKDIGHPGEAALGKPSKDDELVTKSIHENSYEISPYQCSDDEGEEENDLPSKKCIPSWASKSCVALALSAHQTIDPDVIFPRESFCCIDEVAVVFFAFCGLKKIVIDLDGGLRIMIRVLSSTALEIPSIVLLDYTFHPLFHKMIGLGQIRSSVQPPEAVPVCKQVSTSHVQGYAIHN